MNISLDDLRSKAGQKEHQQLFEKLFELSLLGMNIGTGGNPETSGEIMVLKYLRDYYKTQESLIIFDVGANVGEYSKLLDDFFCNKAMIYAFEPSQKAYQELIKNNTKKNFIPNNFGFSDCNQKRLLYSNYEGSCLASLYQRQLKHFDIDFVHHEEIETKTIDAYCATNNIQQIHFLKLDVEGHELNVLKGAEHMLTMGLIDFIQFEFGGCNIDSKTFYQDFYYILSDDYKIYRILKDGLIPLPTYREIYEIFTTTNFLAEMIKNNSFI
jgi:FkbM family methyltransferase